MLLLVNEVAKFWNPKLITELEIVEPGQLKQKVLRIAMLILIL
jgi:hypothetical protein